MTAALGITGGTTCGGSGDHLFLLRRRPPLPRTRSSFLILLLVKNAEHVFSSSSSSSVDRSVLPPCLLRRPGGYDGKRVHPPWPSWTRFDIALRGGNNYDGLAGVRGVTPVSVLLRLETVAVSTKGLQIDGVIVAVIDIKLAWVAAEATLHARVQLVLTDTTASIGVLPAKPDYSTFATYCLLHDSMERWR